jgi:ADP-heptose:LPS heptosyltransferase
MGCCAPNGFTSRGNPMAEAQRILVIKLSAFGNIVLSFGPFAAIRAHHANARISVLTTPAYASWFRTMPYFDEVLVDRRPKWWDVPAMLRLRGLLRNGRFDRVYDLQTSGRSSRYLHMFPRAHRPEWSGIASGASHPDRDPDRDVLHDADRQIGQLRQAGIERFPQADLSWCRGDVERFGFAGQTAILVPGSSPHRPGKRWPVERYAELATVLRTRGVTPIIVGSAEERELARSVPDARDLTGQTTPGDIADLARHALFAVGNDTGPMHLIAAIGCPSLVLFSGESDPKLCAPRGVSVAVLQRPALADLDLATVLATLPSSTPPAQAAGVHHLMDARIR